MLKVVEEYNGLLSKMENILPNFANSNGTNPLMIYNCANLSRCGMITDFDSINFDNHPEIVSNGNWSEFLSTCKELNYSCRKNSFLYYCLASNNDIYAMKNDDIVKYRGLLSKIPQVNHFHSVVNFNHDFDSQFEKWKNKANIVCSDINFDEYYEFIKGQVQKLIDSENPSDDMKYAVSSLIVSQIKSLESMVPYDYKKSKISMLRLSQEEKERISKDLHEKPFQLVDDSVKSVGTPVFTPFIEMADEFLGMSSEKISRKASY